MVQPHSPAMTWLTIWSRPRRAIQDYIDHTDDRDRHVLMPALLITTVHLIVPYVAQWRLHNGAGALYLALFAFFGIAVAQLGLWLYTGVLWRVGRGLGGVADHRAVFAAFVWSHIPWLVGGILCVPRDLALELRDLRSTSGAWSPVAGSGSSAADALAIFGAALISFSWVTHLRCQSQVQGYGLRRALGVDLLVGAVTLLIVAPFLFVFLKRM